MTEKNEASSAAIATEVQEAYESIRPQLRTLQLRIDEVQRKVQAFCDGAATSTASWNFLEGWEWSWIPDIAGNFDAGNVLHDAIYYEIGYDDYALPYAVIDHIDEVLADAATRLAAAEEQARVEKAESLAERRAQLVAELAAIDANDDYFAEGRA